MNLWLGFPYNVAANRHKLVMTKWELLKIFILTNVASGILYIWVVAYLIDPFWHEMDLKGLSMSDFSEGSAFDSAAGVSIATISTSVGFCYLIIFKRKSQDFTHLCQELEAFGLQEMQIKEVYYSVIKKIKKLSFLCFVSSVLSVVFFHLSFEKLLNGGMKYPILAHLMKLMVFFNSVISFYGPAHISANFIVLFFMGLVIRICDNLIDKMDDYSWNKKRNEKMSNLFLYVEETKSLGHLIGALSRVLASLILLHSTLCLSLTCAAAFNITGLIFSAWSDVRISYTAMSLSLMIQFFLSMFHIYSQGQTLEDKIGRIRNYLQHLAEVHGMDFKQSEVFQLQGVLDKTRGDDVKIRPYSCFAVNYSSFLSAIGVIITYLIVLMQFKVSE